VTETTGSGRSAPKRGTVSARVPVVGAGALIILGGLVAGYLYGRELARGPLADAEQLINQLQPENRQLQRLVAEQNARVTSLEARLKSTQTAMDAIVPAENTYNIGPNQALVVAGGRLTIGLIGSPTIRSVSININGIQHTAVSGDVFEIALDPSTTCRVGIQSFDMFKVVVTASCAVSKPQ
jgi:hypothetical protein